MSTLDFDPGDTPEQTVSKLTRFYDENGAAAYRASEEQRNDPESPWYDVVAEQKVDVAILEKIKDAKLRSALQAHGFGSHLSSAGDVAKQRIAMLANLFTSRKLIGDVGRFDEGQLYGSAPFMIVSRAGQSLWDDVKTGSIDLKKIVVLMNGQYEFMTPALRSAFPKVRFVTCDELSDSTFWPKKGDIVSIRGRESGEEKKVSLGFDINIGQQFNLAQGTVTISGVSYEKDRFVVSVTDTRGGTHAYDMAYV